ncbi:hypothetical protein RHHCN13_04160 [Rickettsia conorii subsp. heilongjiangensis]|uniref:Magnesium transporter MgtE intracellular domain-containing protein n=1 Tax=Rickettsia conorii subsp. heilongjiangensis TaxID=226665 RepID=A0AAD1LSM3_RICCR|nr:hypothetical protein [Rickettsia conorii]AEK74815.1 hypothetical protein Rh054_04460 [Rickettsia conorii subsp. heilongjiangensis 054]BBM91561.1 hypothetical protein RHCH81_04160 [Rickettsia conorii subsp. heilongjiangensis]BBM92770.1 hypothetical protein RHHCN13_04160 [Rickettsia conorii subsp. heilongjiangensis]BBM93979.1 hypothetical protein RHSENDAI29_04160 [Rickettsia conorii subsp. heilongjiangensis]BBM95188.1 hypothetical protein RHSENDAI58_04160 [Rickettsia conorii subsp. heilongjia
MAITLIFNKLQNLIPHNTSPKLASYLANDEFEFITSPKQTTNTLGISQIRFTDLLNKLDGSEKVTNTPQSKGFFSTFSSSLKTVYDFGVKSFNIIKNTSSILSSKVAETFNFVSNKVFSYLNHNTEETFNLLDQLATLSDNELVEEILNTSENALDEIFESITYKKLVELIDNISDEQAQKLIHYILPEHFEKLIQFIPLDKLNTYLDTTISLEKLTEQELKKLSDEDISNEQLENIIILAGEEKLAENFDIIPNKNLVRIMSNISNDKLATIISHASDESLVRIIDIINSDNHDLSKSLVGQIIALIHGKKCVKQESGAVSDSDSGFSDYEDEVEVSDNQVEHSNSDFTMKLSGEKLSYNYFGVFDYEDDVVYL